MIKNSLRFAIFCGILLCLLFIITNYLGSNPFIEVNHLFADFVIFSIFIYFATKDFRKYVNENLLHFWQGMSIGFITYCLASALFMIFLFAYFQIDSAMLLNYKAEALSFLEGRKEIYIEQFGVEQYDAQKKAIDDTTSTDLIISATIKKLIAGLFVTPVISIILRAKPN